MDVPIGYNIKDGMMGLGDNILLEVMSEMLELPDILHILVLNKKTIVLKDHYRFLILLQTLSMIFLILQ